MENEKAENLRLALCFLIGGLIVFLLMRSCEKPQPAIATHGTFKAVQPAAESVKDIPVVLHDLPIGQKMSKIDTAEVHKFKTLYNLTQKQYDSLLVQNAVLDSIANASNDKRYQELYKDYQFKEFSQTFDNDTLKATVSGITRGAPLRLKLDWELKLQKPKETVFRLLAGAEFGITRTLGKINAKGTIIGQFRSGNQVSIGVDTEQRFYVGGAFSVFDVKK